MGGISIWQIAIIILVIILLFGLGKGKLPNLAKDLGRALRIFRSSVEDQEESATKPLPKSTKSSKNKAKK